MGSFGSFATDCGLRIISPMIELTGRQECGFGLSRELKKAIEHRNYELYIEVIAPKIDDKCLKSSPGLTSIIQ
jgi:hypothetical protein